MGMYVEFEFINLCQEGIQKFEYARYLANSGQKNEKL